ncbi:MAG TPA: sensor histidine kinase [Ramlibacter sp.]
MDTAHSAPLAPAAAPAEHRPAAAGRPALLQRLSLSQQFLLASFPLLLGATLVIGWWVGGQVEDAVVRRVGGVTALYVDSFVAPHVQTLASRDDLTESDRQELSALLANTQLGKKMLSLKIWRPDGRVLFSVPDASEVGKTMPIDAGLRVALGGGIYSELADRSHSEQAEHGAPSARLIETYTPLHADRLGKVIGAAEFYSSPDDVDREVATAQQRSWLVVSGTMAALYFLLSIVVTGGSRKIVEQRQDLAGKVRQLTELNAQNTQLHERVRRAADQAAGLNETFLRRISSDIHDGPGQDLGFALMQLKNILDTPVPREPAEAKWAETLMPVRHAVQSALGDLCAISADLQMPEIEPMPLGGVADRVVRDYESKTGCTVTLVNELDGAQAPLPTKITLYRLLQEALANSFRHAKCRNPRVRLECDAHSLRLQVTDNGPGFDTAAALRKGRLGLTGMRQRAEVLGGSFEVESVPGSGTTVRITLPLAPQEQAHA